MQSLLLTTVALVKQDPAEPASHLTEVAGALAAWSATPRRSTFHHVTVDLPLSPTRPGIAQQPVGPFLLPAQHSGDHVMHLLRRHCFLIDHAQW